jgi:hypothetical protein
MGKGRRAHHRLDECRNPEGTPKRDEITTINTSHATHNVIVEEYTSNNGCRIVQIGVTPKVVIGEDLPADYDLGIETLEVEKEDDHLSQKQKAQKRSYWSWLFWR